MKSKNFRAGKILKEIDYNWLILTEKSLVLSLNVSNESCLKE